MYYAIHTTELFENNFSLRIYNIDYQYIAYNTKYKINPTKAIATVNISALVENIIKNLPFSFYISRYFVHSHIYISPFLYYYSNYNKVILIFGDFCLILLKCHFFVIQMKQKDFAFRKALLFHLYFIRNYNLIPLIHV